MKVLNLHCASGHTFEGWFANEDDFQNQHARGLLGCPVCNCPDVRKGLSAPRLHLRSAQEPVAQPTETASPVTTTTQPSVAPAWMQAWQAISRELAAHSEDVGARFAQEARKMHYGETEDRSIRGRATAAEVVDLLDEGIDILPLALPDPGKHTLQ